MPLRAPISVSTSRLKTSTRTRSTFVMRISEDLSTELGNERMLLSIEKPHHEILAVMTPMTMGSARTSKNDKDRWVALIVEGITKADTEGASFVTLEVKDMPVWFHILANECGFDPSTREYMTIELDQPKEKGK